MKKHTIDSLLKRSRVSDASFPYEVYQMQNEVARAKKIDKNYIRIRRIGNDEYEYSSILGDTLAVYNNKNGKLRMY